MPSLLLFLSFLTFTKTYFILCCSCKALGFTGFKVVSYVDFSKYGATLPYNISLLFYSFSSPPVDSLVLIICFFIMLLSIFIISSAFIFSIDTVYMGALQNYFRFHEETWFYFCPRFHVKFALFNLR